MHARADVTSVCGSASGRGGVYSDTCSGHTDELSVLDFMRKYGMPERINSEVLSFLALLAQKYKY